MTLSPQTGSETMRAEEDKETLQGGPRQSPATAASATSCSTAFWKVRGNERTTKEFRGLENKGHLHPSFLCHYSSKSAEELGPWHTWSSRAEVTPGLPGWRGCDSPTVSTCQEQNFLQALPERSMNVVRKEPDLYRPVVGRESSHKPVPVSGSPQDRITQT